MMAQALGLRPETWRKWVAATAVLRPGAKNPRGRKPGIPSAIRELLRAQYLKKYKQWGPAVLAAWARRIGLGRWSPTTVARAIEDLKDAPVQRKVPKRLRLTAPGVLWSEDGAGPYAPLPTTRSWGFAQTLMNVRRSRAFDSLLQSFGLRTLPAEAECATAAFPGLPKPTMTGGWRSPWHLKPCRS